MSNLGFFDARDTNSSTCVHGTLARVTFLSLRWTFDTRDVLHFFLRDFSSSLLLLHARPKPGAEGDFVRGLNNR